MAVAGGELHTSLQDFYVTPESAFDTVTSVSGAVIASDAAGGPCKVLSSNFGISEPEEFRDDARQDLADYDTTEMLKEYVWSTEHRIVPVRAGGNFPELHPLLRAVFDANTTISGGRRYSWTAAGIHRPVSLQLTRAFNGKADRLVAEQINGAFVSQCTFRAQGGQPPLVAFSGEGASFRRATTAEVLSGASGGVINFAAGENRGRGYDVGMRVVVDGDDNSGTGYPIASVTDDSIDTGGDTWTSLSSGDLVQPFVPDPTYHARQIIGATSGAVTIDTQTFPVTAWDLTIDFAPDFKKDIYGAASMRGVVRTVARVTGNITIRANENANYWANYARQHPAIAIVLDMGTTTGGDERRWRLNVPKAKINPAQIQTPAGSLGRFTIPFMALASADGAVDHLNLEVGY